jgi:hypothetical protein
MAGLLDYWHRGPEANNHTTLGHALEKHFPMKSVPVPIGHQRGAPPEAVAGLPVAGQSNQQRAVDDAHG